MKIHFMLLRVVVLQRLTALDYKDLITINEVNIDTGAGGFPFIELRFGDFCMFKRTSTPLSGPVIQKLFLILADERLNIHRVFDLADKTFKNNSGLFVLGPSEHADLATHSGQHRVRHRHADRFLQNGDKYAEAVLLVNPLVEKDLQTLRKLTTRNVPADGIPITVDLREILSKWTIDMVIYGRLAIGNCSEFNDLGADKMVGAWLLREVDNFESNRWLDFSLSKCGDYTKLRQPFRPQYFTLDTPTPGKENFCQGVTFANNVDHLIFVSKYFVEKENDTCDRPKTDDESVAESCGRLNFTSNPCTLRVKLSKITPIRNRLWKAKQRREKTQWQNCAHVMSQRRPRRKISQYHEILETVRDNCSTADEMLAKLNNSMTPEQLQVMQHFLHDVSRYKPAGSSTRTDLIAWTGTAAGLVGAGLGAALGWVISALFGGAGSAATGAASTAAGAAGSAASGLIDDALDSISESNAVDNSIADDIDDGMEVSEESAESDDSDDQDHEPERSTTSSTSRTTTTQTSTTTTASTTTTTSVIPTPSEIDQSISGACLVKSSKFATAVTPCGRPSVIEGVSGADKLIKLSELSKISTETCLHCVGTVNEADLILSRIGIFFDGWEREKDTSEFLEGKYVCRKHVAELGISWHKQQGVLKYKKTGTKSFRACMFPNLKDFSLHLTSTRAHHSYTMYKEQSRAVSVLRQALVPVGSTLCQKHYNEIQDTVAEMRVQNKQYCLRPQPPISLAQSPPLHKPPIISTGCSNEDDEHYAPPRILGHSARRQALKAFAKAAGINDLRLPTVAFNLLSPRSTRRYVRTVRLLQVCAYISMSDKIHYSYNSRC